VSASEDATRGQIVVVSSSRPSSLLDTSALRRPLEFTQYTSKAYLGALADAGTKVSMSRKGDCWDNAVAESTFASIKTEAVHDPRFRSREEARHALVEYLDGFYNTTRQHSTNDYMSPADFEAEHAQASASVLT